MREKAAGLRTVEVVILIQFVVSPTFLHMGKGSGFGGHETMLGSGIALGSLVDNDRISIVEWRGGL